jgi:hypothetical protein
MLIEVCKHVVTNMLEVNINVLSTSGPWLNPSAFFGRLCCDPQCIECLCYANLVLRLCWN